MKNLVRGSTLVITLLLVSGFTECYKPVTKSQLPEHIKTVAVPSFQNNALRYKIEHRFTRAVMDELVHRGHGIRVQSDREGADAVIDGVVKTFGFSGVLLDDKGRARIFEVTITAAVTVRDQHENRVLYDNQNFVFRGEFEFANDPRNFFNEEDPAVMRIARSFANQCLDMVNSFGVGVGQNPAVARRPASKELWFQFITPLQWFDNTCLLALADLIRPDGQSNRSISSARDLPAQSGAH